MIEAIIFAALKSLVQDGSLYRCYPIAFPQQGERGFEQWPAIRYAVVSSNNEADIDGTDTVETDETRMQIDIVARTHGAVIMLRDEVITAMMGLDPPATRQEGSGFQVFDAETRTYRVVLEYVFSASSVAMS